MPLVSLCLLAGAIALQWLPRLPDNAALVVLGAMALGLTAYKLTRAPACLVFGLSVMGVSATDQLDDRLEPSLQSVAVTAVVTIREFPVSRNGQVSLVASPKTPAGLPSLVRLSWLEPDVMPQLGETWRLEVRLRRPSGYANPGGFDYE
ncbi:MAG: DUF4131 domain-containing protein, partial [Gammaproteobacteria bacterium]|nr:DUF4131 domain-containing protein [Gammaproteobacteria bacterium]